MSSGFWPRCRPLISPLHHAASPLTPHTQPSVCQRNTSHTSLTYQHSLQYVNVRQFFLMALYYFFFTVQHYMYTCLAHRPVSVTQQATSQTTARNHCIILGISRNDNRLCRGTAQCWLTKLFTTPGNEFQWGFYNITESGARMILLTTHSYYFTLAPKPQPALET